MAGFRRKTLLGYADRLGVAPGGTVRFMVSSEEEAGYDVALVRLLGGDLHPEGTGLRTREVATECAGSRPGRRQSIEAGSFAWFGDDARLRAASLSVAVLAWPTAPAAGTQVLLSHAGADGRGWRLLLDERGAPALELDHGDGRVQRLSSGSPLRGRCWYRVMASVDAEAGRLRIWHSPLDGCASGDVERAREQPLELPPPAVPAGSPLLLAAALAGDGRGRPRVRHCYNGKLEAPRIARGALGEADLGALLQAPPPARLRAGLLLDIPSLRVTDTGPLALQGRVENLPARAMTGHLWDGSEQCWRHAPAHYGAIHFHDDDLHDEVLRDTELDTS